MLLIQLTLHHLQENQQGEIIQVPLCSDTDRKLLAQYSVVILSSHTSGTSVKVFILTLFRHHTSGQHRNGLQRTLIMVGTTSHTTTHDGRQIVSEN